MENKLISYCIPVDDGAAPNPFWGICTLVICKPVVRRVTANVGDWIVGVGSKNVLGTDYSGKIIYAMRVSKIMTMEEYDEYCKTTMPEKIPDFRSEDKRKWLGDSIYDFSQSSPLPPVRDSVHNESNREHDLNGKNAILSDHFYYFGKDAVQIPDAYSAIIRQGQGHQFKPNDDVKYNFIQWLTETHQSKLNMPGTPQLWDQLKKVEGNHYCSSCRIKEAVEDEFDKDSNC